MPQGRRIPPPPIFNEEDAGIQTQIAPDKGVFPRQAAKRRIPPPPIFDAEEHTSLGDDLYSILTGPGRTLNEGLADLEIGPGPSGRPGFTKNPIAGGAKVLRSVGEAIAAPFGIADRLLRTNRVTTPIAEGAALPFELVSGAVRGGESLIDDALRSAGISEEALNLGMKPETAREASTALSALNEMTAQFLLPVAGKKVGGTKTGGGLAGKIVKMQEQAQRPTYRPSTSEPVDYVAPESRQLYPPRNQRFEQRPGQPVRDIQAGPPVRRVPPLLEERNPLRKPDLEPIRTFEVGPEGGARPVKSTPAPIPTRIEKALSDVGEKTRKRIIKKILVKQELSIGERNLIAQRDAELFDMIDKGTLPDLPEGGIRGGDLFQPKPAEAPPVDLGAAPAVPLDPKLIEKKLFTLRDKLNEKGRYRGRVADLTEAELLARRHGYEVSTDPGTGKTAIISPEGKKLRKVPELKMNERAADPILLEDIAPVTRTRIQDIADEVGADIDVSSLSRDQIKAAIKDLKEDAGKEGTYRAQLLIEELLKAEREGTVGVVAESAPGIGKDIRGVNINDLLEQKYEREGTLEQGGSMDFKPVVEPKVNISETWGDAVARNQYDFVLTATDPQGRVLGKVSISDYNGEPSVNMIEVSPTARRKGVGLQLLQAAQERYPEKSLQVQGDFATEAGQGLWEKFQPTTRAPGDPVTFEKTPAGEQGSFATLDPAKIPDRKPSGISHESQIEGTMFEKKRTPPPLQEEIFGGEGRKEPWQMTRNEYENYGVEDRLRDRNIPKENLSYARLTEQNDNLIYHKNQVHTALSDGKPVPPEVLKDYPDLNKSSRAPEGGASNPSWNDAVSESLTRLKETGLSPDKPQGNLPSGLDPTTVIDPKKVKYIVNPIIKKATAEARKLVLNGQLKPENFTFYAGNVVKDLLVEHPDFRALSGAQKRAVFDQVRRASRGLVFNPVVGEFQTQEARKFRAEMQKAQGGLTPAPIEGGRIISEPMKRENINPTEIFSDGMKSFTEREFSSTMGEYVKKQGRSGESLVRSINRDYRESAQWAGKLEREYRDAVKVLSDEQFDAFVSLADAGGASKTPSIQKALDTWKGISKQIADRAMAAELEIATFDRAKGDFVKVPFKPMENYFPHEFDITEIKKAANREKYLERIADRYKVPKSEAEWIFNKWVRSRIEVKYGHLEHARDFDIGGWKRSRDVIPAHIERATRRITQAEIYGKDYTIAQNYIEQILNAGGDYKAAQTLFDRVVGREDYNRQWAKIQRNINSWHVATKLTLLAVLNPTQLNNAGLIAGWRSMGKQFVRQFHDYPAMKEFADRAGSILESTLRMHQQEALSLDGIGSKMMKLTGVTAEERWLRTLSTNIIADYFGRDGKRLQNPRVYAELQRKLNYLNLGKDVDLVAAKARGGFSEKDLLNIGYEGARKTQFLGRPQDLPKLISNPHLKMFTQFKSFITQQTKLMNDAVLKELRHGNVKPALYVLSMFPLAGEVALDVKSLIQGRDRPDHLFWRALEDITAVGALGILGDLAKQTARDPQGLMKWLAGPTVSDASELGYGLGQAGQGKLRPLQRFGAKQIPIPLIQQAVSDALRTEPKKRRGITQ